MVSIPEVLHEDIPNAVKEHEPMIVCHFSKDELTALDRLQGGVNIDESTGLREYSELSDKIKNPEVKKFLDNLFFDIENDNLPENLKLLKENTPKFPKKYIKDPADYSPEIQAIEQEGEGGDDELALVPESLADYLDSIRGYTDRNPHTGLRQYKFFKELLRAAGQIGGAIVGGPIGAMVGGGLAHKITGGKFGHGIKNGLFTGLGMQFGPKILQGASDMFGGGTGMFDKLGNAFGLGGGNSPGGIAYSYADGSGANMVGNTGAKLGVPTGKGALLNSISPAQASAGGNSSGFLGNLFGGEEGKGGGLLGNLFGGNSPLGKKFNLLDADAIGANYKQYKKGSRDMKAREERDLKQRQEDYQNLNNQFMGFKSYGLPSYSSNNYNSEGPYQSFMKTGGHATYKAKPNVKDRLLPNKSFLIKGPGKGQDDLINTKLREGDFIVDASTVSNLGDGSTNAGKKQLDHMVYLIKKHKGGHVKNNKGSRIVPAALSNDEYRIDHSIVTGIGHGDNKKGGELLQKWMENIRHHKTSERKSIPPKAKPIMEYFSRRML